VFGMPLFTAGGNEASDLARLRNWRPSRWPRSAWIGPAISPGARA